MSDGMRPHGVHNWWWRFIPAGRLIIKSFSHDRSAAMRPVLTAIDSRLLGATCRSRVDINDKWLELWG